MTIQDILVYVDNGKACENRLQAAIQVAATHEAHLIGLYTLSDPDLPGYVEVEIPVDILELQAERAVEAAKRAEEAFEEATEKAGISAEWRCLEGDAIEILISQARYVDLLVISQHDPEDSMASIIYDIPDQVILEAGRPVLVVPYTYRGDGIGKRVMVGWDASQLASRAIHDALPFLERADKVTVMVINPEVGIKGHGDLPGADVAAHLARHNVCAEADHVTNTDVNTGDQLLSRAADLDADLVVTGAYGHARWKELILGGVTRHLLESMPVPVLMSH